MRDSRFVGNGQGEDISRKCRRSPVDRPLDVACGRDGQVGIHLERRTIQEFRTQGHPASRRGRFQCGANPFLGLASRIHRAHGGCRPDVIQHRTLSDDFSRFTEPEHVARCGESRDFDHPAVLLGPSLHFPEREVTGVHRRRRNKQQKGDERGFHLVRDFGDAEVIRIQNNGKDRMLHRHR